MASATTINTWIDQLAASILAKSTLTSKRRRTEAFRRRIRNHPYGRTNQFDVRERLDGLEEKFQILNRDDLSDSLYERRLELREHAVQWLPDALDLLLRLSNNPVGRTSITALHEIEPKTLLTSASGWTETSVEDISDSDDPIWKRPSWSDLSSEDDEVDPSSTKTSPESVKVQKKSPVEQVNHHALFEPSQPEKYEPPPLLLPEQITTEEEEGRTSVVVNEIQLIRETLLMVQGYPSPLFLRSEKRAISLDKRVVLEAVSSGVPGRLLQPIYTVRRRIDMIRKWIQEETPEDFMQLIRKEVGDVLQHYLTKVNSFARSLAQPETTTVVTLLGTVGFLDEAGTQLKHVASYVQSILHTDNATDSLGKLYSMICQMFYCHNVSGMATLMPIFLKALGLYMTPIIEWLKYGKINTVNWPYFFIHPAKKNQDRSTLWHGGHVVRLEGSHKPPAFLLPYVKDILICGKTSEFLQLLQPTSELKDGPLQDLLDNMMERIRALTEEDTTLPFPTAFDSMLNTTIVAALNERTTALKQVLNNQCGLIRCLDAFDHIYLRKNGTMMDNLETKVFTRMDRCQDNWNDRFLVADILQDICYDIPCIDIDSIAVRSTHTSSRSMESRRRSVKIMGALAIKYTLPWPIANIIPTSAMNAYRRISLHLAQIRRAKYVLERIAFPTVHSNSIADNVQDQKIVQALTFILITLTNTLYDHFTTGVVKPWTNHMRNNLHSAATMDEMISVHRSYISRLQHACLITKPFKVLRDTMTDLLDMCIRFADLVTSAVVMVDSKKTKQGNPVDDFETSSFMSAQSQSRSRRKRRRRQAERRKAKLQNQHEDDVLPSSSSEDEIEGVSSSTDDEDALISSGEGEGYSSFIVLDETTTVMMEIKKLQIQFKRQLDFFVAGLHSVGKVGDGQENNGREYENAGVEGLDVLAERLSWKGKRPIVGIGI